MKFLFRKYPAKRDEAIEVQLSAPATVKFMTAKEFKHYVAGRTHTYYKGQQEEDLIRFRLPFDGIWHAVVEKGDADIQATCKLCAPSPALQAIEPDNEELEHLSMGSQSEG
ncbi:MAG: DUF1883 domain-containing protein [Flavobacteriales bacterium]|jgi:hypothetical protein|nr:DUF1883 domain-containing protein [Flavobacteriales bacterium]MCB0759146.1 DUF1883 domain-containing protein [Flavobacteriales bacterium]